MQRGLIGRALLAELAQHATSSSQCQAPLRLATPSDGVATTAGGLSTTGSRSPRVATTVAARRTCARLVRLYACRATSYQRPQIERGHASLSRWPSYGRVGTIRALPRVVPKEPVSPRGALCTPTGRSCSTGRRAVEPGDDAEAHALGGHRPRRRRGRAGRVGKWLAVETAASAVGCEGCGTRSVGHGRRRVKVQDLPMANRPVVLVWAKRIWRCPDPDSPVTTWSEEVDEIAP
jgi:hypothetical protein